MPSKRGLHFYRLTSGGLGALASLTLAGSLSHASEYRPIIIGTWAFSPSIALNAIFRNQQGGAVAGNNGSSFGTELSPAFTLVRDGESGATAVSGSASASFYAGRSDTSAHSEQIAFSHAFKFSKEQTFKIDASFANSNGGLFSSSSGLSSTGSAGSTTIFRVGASTERRFGRVTAALSASASRSDVDNNLGSAVIVGSTPGVGTGVGGSGLITALPNGRSSTYSVAGSLSYDAPVFSPFISTSVNWQEQPTVDVRSMLVQAGVRTARISLFHGEAHVGYLISQADYNLLGVSTQVRTSSPTVGASITWDPLRYLVISAGVDAQFGAVTLPSLGSVLSPSTPVATPVVGPTTPGIPTGGLPTGQSGTTVTFNANAKYSFSRQWSATAALGYSMIESNGQRTNVEMASVAGTYTLSRASTLLLSYSFLRSDPGLNVILGVPGPAERIVTNVVKAGVQHRF